MDLKILEKKTPGEERLKWNDIMNNKKYKPFFSNSNMDKYNIISDYLAFLTLGDYDKIISLFSKNAIVISPLYGRIRAKKFYKNLLNDSKKSRIKLIDVFYNKTQRALGYFKYDWILKNNSSISFYGVDVFKFNKDGKIDEMRILYDTYPIRKSFNKLKK